jgi:hypothetical protein
MDRVCVCVFIGVSARTCMSIYFKLCFLKKKLNVLVQIGAVRLGEARPENAKKRSAVWLSVSTYIVIIWGHHWCMYASLYCRCNL